MPIYMLYLRDPHQRSSLDNLARNVRTFRTLGCHRTMNYEDMLYFLYVGVFFAGEIQYLRETQD